MDKVLDCCFTRRFGAEIELNTANGVVVKLDEDEGDIPLGSDRVANLISNTLLSKVELQGWDWSHNNDFWIVKPDSSCGIEICTPILKGWLGLESLIRVVKALNESKMNSDKRCSFHLHINIADLTKEQLATVFAYYIKCEHVIFDAMPSWRKINRYCQFLGMSDLFDVGFNMDMDELICKVSGVKYYSINAYHFLKGGGFTWRNNRKKTFEVRTGENDMCLDPYHVKNWVRFLIHFVEMTKNMPYPGVYKNGNQWSGLAWLGLKEVMHDVLKFDKSLSEGLNQVKRWFIGRMLKHGYGHSDVPLIFSDKARSLIRADLLEMISPHTSPEYYFDNGDEALFGRRYAI